MRHFLPIVAVAGAALGCTAPAVLNSVTPSSGYRFTSVVYDAAQRLSLDLYTPQQARRVPVVVFFHGGRWQHGTPAEFRFVGQALASRGFIAVVPDYRRYPAGRVPEFMQDAARAVRWTEQQIGRYGGDPARIFVMGHSSGAHMAALLALNPELLAAAGGDRRRLRGMIGLAGAYDFLPLTAPDLRDIFGPPERFEWSQPVTHVDGRNPPLLLLHGADDDTVDARNTLALAEAVQRAGGPVERFLYPEMGHRWIIATLAAPLRGRTDVLERIVAFVRRHSAAPPPSGIVGSARDEPAEARPVAAPLPEPPATDDPEPRPAP